jgi:hypothetical protein
METFIKRFVIKGADLIYITNQVDYDAYLRIGYRLVQ